MTVSDQAPPVLRATRLVGSGGLGREVSWALRAATLPGVEYVLPLIANTHLPDAGTAAARLLRHLLTQLRRLHDHQSVLTVSGPRQPAESIVQCINKHPADEPLVTSRRVG